jgi:hypothetical protein
VGRALRGVLTGVGCLAVIGILIVVVVIVVVAVSLSGGGGTAGSGGGEGGGSDKVVARVSGTQGIKFSGNIGTLDKGRSVDGTIPAEYQVKEFDTSELSTDTVSMVMQKSGRQGKMTCEIAVGGKVVKSASTTANYGTCDVTWSPME